MGWIRPLLPAQNRGCVVVFQQILIVPHHQFMTTLKERLDRGQHGDLGLGRDGLRGPEVAGGLDRPVRMPGVALEPGQVQGDVRPRRAHAIGQLPPRQRQLGALPIELVALEGAHPRTAQGALGQFAFPSGHLGRVDGLQILHRGEGARVLVAKLGLHP